MPLALPEGPSFLASRDPTDLGGMVLLAATALAIAARIISNDDAEVTVMADTAAGESGLPQLLVEKIKNRCWQTLLVTEDAPRWAECRLSR